MNALRKTGILAVALTIAVIGITGCPNPGAPGQPPVSESFTVEMTAGEHGTVSASPEIPADGKVAKDTVITFTATPDEGYIIGRWTISGGSIVAGAGTRIKITSNTKVHVSFNTECTVEMTAGENGTVSADPEIPANRKIAKDTVVTFTAKPDKNFMVEKWTVTGGTVEEGGTSESTTAKVKITSDTKVEVSFIPDYKPVAFNDLENYLRNIASTTEINYIRVTGLTAADLKGSSKPPYRQSELGKILKRTTEEHLNPTKKIALKLDSSELTGLTDMSGCFYDCRSLTQVSGIPDSVTNMEGCFSYCTSLTQAPVIPSGVTDMEGCFYDCTSLTQAPVIPSGVTDMKRCFSFCERLTQAPVIPSGVTNMEGCFSSCSSLTQAPVIPSGVTNMKGCFGACTSLMQAPVIPSSVLYMNSCFAGCRNITAVTLKCDYNPGTIPGSGSLHDGAFEEVFYDCYKLETGSIKVPAAQLQTYKDNAWTMRARANWFIGDGE